jgi:Fe-S cluster assembly protein SufB
VKKGLKYNTNKMSQTKQQSLSVSDTWNFQDNNVAYTNEIIKGITPEVVRQISDSNNEPLWMLELRLKALKLFKEKTMPSF